MKRIDILLDDILLEIFDFYLNLSELYRGKRGIEAWQSLVHVCRRWRNLVLGSPRRLNLRLICTPQTSVKDTLDVWPTFPLLVVGNMASRLSSSTENVIAALGQSNRVCDVSLVDIVNWQFEKVMAAMQVSFPALTVLQLSSHGESLSSVIPDSFLDGSAPSLRYFSLSGIPFPALPNLLLSATHLDSLWLSNIPHSGYISPEAIVALLSMLSSLRTLSLRFQSPQSGPDWQNRSPPPPKRSILPALREFRFKGVTEYLEDLVTFIDAPQLDEMHITFFNQIDFDCPRLAQFINCTPKLRALDEAHVDFDFSTVSVKLGYGTPQSALDNLEIAISCRERDWQLSSIEQVCNSLQLLSTVNDLYIGPRPWIRNWNNPAIENAQWVQLLLPFTVVKNLYLSRATAPGVPDALDELVGDRITEVLPKLQNIFVDELNQSVPFQEKIGRFFAARQLSDHPITISVRK